MQAEHFNDILTTVPVLDLKQSGPLNHQVYDNSVSLFAHCTKLETRMKEPINPHYSILLSVVYVP